MTWSIVLAIVIAFVITAVLGPVIIPWLRNLKFGQTEREEGVQSHLKKAGTPTMGGIMFLIGGTVAALIFLPGHPKMLPVLVLTLGFGVIGFLDDYLKVVKKHSDGLLPKQKLLLQFIVTGLFLFCMLKFTDVTLQMRIPFTGGRMLDLGWFAYPFLFIVVLATVNGVNFTDGVDGLASSVTTVVAGFFLAVSIGTAAGIEPLPCAIIGGLMGFLCYNLYPAKIFMGDTGSLALGGFVAASAYMLNLPLWIPIVGLIYAIELISVVLQVLYFKKTKGKRLFKMAPIHHHFELSGWSETRVVGIFTIITVLLCFVGYMAL